MFEISSSPYEFEDINSTSTSLCCLKIHNNCCPAYPVAPTIPTFIILASYRFYISFRKLDPLIKKPSDITFLSLGNPINSFLLIKKSVPVPQTFEFYKYFHKEKTSIISDKGLKY